MFEVFNTRWAETCACAGTGLFEISGEEVTCADIDDVIVESNCVGLAGAEQCARVAQLCSTLPSLYAGDATLDDGAEALSVGLRWTATATQVLAGSCVTEDPCNTSDDDCDGAVDEGLGDACETGLPGACATGSLACGVGGAFCAPTFQPVDEVCDAVDSDCNGVVDDVDVDDDGFNDCFDDCAPDNAAIHPGALEVCDGSDNDCNGEQDDSFDDLDVGCDTGRAGICADGVLVCHGEQGLVCEGPAPTTESCNTVDDDCDGEPDNGVCGLGDACSGNDECPAGECLATSAALALDRFVCTQACTIHQDADADGVNDADAPLEDCVGADETFRCVVTDSGSLCLPGATLAPCEGSGDCLGGESCLPVGAINRCLR